MSRNENDQPTKKLSGFDKTTLGCIVFGLFIGLLFVSFILYVLWGWQDHTPRGALAQQSDWPIDVRELCSEMTAAGVNVSSAQVYLLKGVPGDFAESVILRLPDSPEAMNYLQSKLSLIPVPQTRLDRMIFHASNDAPSDWWPDPQSQPEYLASRRKIAGEEADQYFIARDKKNGTIFVHYYFNF